MALIVFGALARMTNVSARIGVARVPWLLLTEYLCQRVGGLLVDYKSQISNMYYMNTHTRDYDYVNRFLLSCRFQMQPWCWHKTLQHLQERPTLLLTLCLSSLL